MPKNFRTVSKDIACSLFPNHGVEATRQASGFVTAAPKTNLVPLTVLAAYDTLGLSVGDIVYVPLEYANSTWGKRRLKVEGVGEFILVPAEQVHLAAKNSLC